MRRKVLAAIFLLTMLPTVSLALSAEEIRTQINELLSRIAALQEQLNNLTAQTPASPPEFPVRHRICSILYRNLSQGTSGDDVLGLQEFLQENGYLSVSPTGFFGPVTANAVASWQSSEGVSAVGSFGPLSRERIRIWCAGNQRFRASPQNGPSPLTVTFYSNISGFHSASDTYTIEFGDSSSEPAASCYAPTDYCQRPGTNTHTYTADGSYTAQLVHINDPCAGIPECAAAVHREVLGTVSIRVGEIVCPAINAPAANTCSGTWRVETEDGCPQWRCIPGSFVCPMAQCQLLHCPSGQHAVSDLPTYDAHGCRSNSCATHCVLDDGAGIAPAISSFSGPTTLAVGQTGTWSVQASDPENGQLSYKISWGDSFLSPYASLSAIADGGFVQTTTFTHAYAAAGVYTVSITVRDESGQSAQTTTTVQVGSSAPVACTADAYQCPNGQWVGRTGSSCQFVCPDTSITFLGTTPASTGASCVTPWGNQTVQHNGLISNEPYFTNGLNMVSFVVPLRKCSNGTWLTCDSQGNNCVNLNTSSNTSNTSTSSSCTFASSPSSVACAGI